MTRALRYAFNGIATVSAVICLAACALWVRGLFVGDVLARTTYEGKAVQHLVGTYSRLGRIGVVFSTTRYTGLPPEELEAPDSRFFTEPSGLRWQQVHRPQEGGSLQDPSPRMSYLHRLGFGWERGQSRRGRLGLSLVQEVDQFDAAAPLWFVAALGAVAPAVWLRRRWLAARRSRPGLCPECGYDLRATPGRCPECGGTTPAAAAASPPTASAPARGQRSSA